MDGKLCSNASAGKAPEATLAAALILSFFLRITVSMPAPSRPLHRGKRTIAVDKSCHLPLWKQVPRLHLALTVEANVVRLCISDSRRTQRYEDHLCWLRSINDIFPFGSVTPVRFLDPRKQAVGFGECVEPGATAP